MSYLEIIVTVVVTLLIALFFGSFTRIGRRGGNDRIGNREYNSNDE